MSPKFLGQYLLENRVGALADIRGHGQQMCGAVRKDFDLGGGEGILGVEPVEDSPGDKAVAADTDAVAFLFAAAVLLPVGHFPDRFKGFNESAARYGGHIRNLVSGDHGVFDPQVNGIDTQLLGGDIHLRLCRKKGLRRAKTAHGTCRWFVGVYMFSHKTVMGIAVEHGPEISAQKRGRGTHGIVGPAVQIDVQILCHQGAVFFKADLGAQFHGMASAAGGELLLPGQGKFDRFAGFFGHEGGTELPWPQLHFTAETAADSRFDHADVVFTHVERGRQQALHDVGNLGRCPEGYPAVEFTLGQGCAGLEIGRTYGVDRKNILTDIIGLCKPFLNAAILNFSIDADVAGGCLVDNRCSLGQGILNIENSRQFLVFHAYQFKGFGCDVLVNRRNSGNFVANEADLVHGQGVFVLGNRKQSPVAIFDFGCVFPGDDTFDTGQGSGFAHVNVENTGMGQRASQKLAMQHARQFDVVGVNGTAGGFFTAVRSGDIMANYLVFITHGGSSMSCLLSLLGSLGSLSLLGLLGLLSSLSLLSLLGLLGLLSSLSHLTYGVF